MPWSISFAQDTSTKGIGTAMAVHTDGVSHAATIDTNTGKGISDFIATAKALLAAKQTEKTAVDAIVSKITTELNK
jgi:hypothetical protein